MFPQRCREPVIKVLLPAAAGLPAAQGSEFKTPLKKKKGLERFAVSLAGVTQQILYISAESTAAVEETREPTFR